MWFIIYSLKYKVLYFDQANPKRKNRSTAVVAPRIETLNTMVKEASAEPPGQSCPLPKVIPTAEELFGTFLDKEEQLLWDPVPSKAEATEEPAS